MATPEEWIAIARAILTLIPKEKHNLFIDWCIVEETTYSRAATSLLALTEDWRNQYASTIGK